MSADWRVITKKKDGRSVVIRKGDATRYTRGKSLMAPQAQKTWRRRRIFFGLRNPNSRFPLKKCRHASCYGASESSDGALSFFGLRGQAVAVSAGQSCGRCADSTGMQQPEPTTGHNQKPTARRIGLSDCHIIAVAKRFSRARVPSIDYAAAWNLHESTS